MNVVGSQGGFMAPGFGAVSAPTDADLDQAPPSSYAVTSLVRGEPGALLRVAGLTAVRSFFIAPGIYLAGKAFGFSDKLTPWKLAGASLITSISLSTFMCAWYWYRDTVQGVRPPRS